MAHQQHAAFDMRGERELVKERAGADAVRLAEGVQVGGEGFRVAVDVEDARIAGDEGEGCRINAGARRIDEDGIEIVGGEVDAVLLQAAEGAHATQRFAQFFGGKAGD